jgi:cell division transport system permease protein
MGPSMISRLQAMLGGDLAHAWNSARRQWGTQLATFTVLSATFAIVVFASVWALNLQRLVAHWGESVQVAVYLHDELGDLETARLRDELLKDPRIQSVEVVTKKMAVESFKGQMASYAPDLLDDEQFATPFPASLKLRLSDQITAQERVKTVEGLAVELKKLRGVEDVSYGQSWIKSYASSVDLLVGIGVFLGMVLLAGSLLVIGNAIRAGLAARREEIEIMELIGATLDNLRRPYLVEGAAISFASILAALLLNAFVFDALLQKMKGQLAFSHIAMELRFLTTVEVLTTVGLAVAVGCVGSWLAIRQMNDGWAAARRSGGRA